MVNNKVSYVFIVHIQAVINLIMITFIHSSKPNYKLLDYQLYNYIQVIECVVYVEEHLIALCPICSLQ